MESPTPILVIVKGGNVGTTIPIADGALVIGSGTNVDLPLAYEGVSRRHALLKHFGGRVLVVDLGSLNGTWVNGRKITGETALADRDQIGLGSVLLRFRQLQEDARTSPIDVVSHFSYLQMPMGGQDGIRRKPLGASPATTKTASMAVDKQIRPKKSNKKRDFGVLIGLLSLIVAALELIHSIFGVGVSPVGVAAEQVKRIVDTPPPVTTGPPQVTITPFDSDPPSAPSNLRVTGSAGCSIDLEWDHSSDNVEVKAYRVFAGAILSGLVEGHLSEFRAIMFPREKVVFTVVAMDTGGNDSLPSNAVLALPC